jgi:hypothetical protein
MQLTEIEMLFSKLNTWHLLSIKYNVTVPNNIKINTEIIILCCYHTALQKEKGSLVFLRRMNQRTIANLVSLERSASIVTEENFRDMDIQF